LVVSPIHPPLGDIKVLSAARVKKRRCSVREEQGLGGGGFIGGEGRGGGAAEAVARGR
jgi:hypothetical protein